MAALISTPWGSYRPPGALLRKAISKQQCRATLALGARYQHSPRCVFIQPSGDQCRHNVDEDPPIHPAPPTQPPSLADLGASAMCSVASLSVGVPQEVIKQRLVTGIYPSFRVGVATLWRTEGIRGFYTGFVPTAARNMPFVCMTFTAFRCVCGCLLSAPCTRTRPRLGPSLSHALSLLFHSSPLSLTNPLPLSQHAAIAGARAVGRFAAL